MIHYSNHYYRNYPKLSCYRGGKKSSNIYSNKGILKNTFIKQSCKPILCKNKNLTTQGIYFKTDNFDNSLTEGYAQTVKKTILNIQNWLKAFKD